MKERSLGKEICSFLEKKLVFFNQYLLMTEQIKEACARNKEEYPGALISQRQACIYKIERIDESIKEIVVENLDRLDRLSEKCKAIIDGYLKRLKIVMQTVDLVDRELMVTLQADRKNMKKALLELQDMRQGAQGYKNKRELPPRFLDTVW
jgi:uncharacterized membrane protein